jgi:hypothetical protein
MLSFCVDSALSKLRRSVKQALSPSDLIACVPPGFITSDLLVVGEQAEVLGRVLAHSPGGWGRPFRFGDEGVAVGGPHARPYRDRPA